MLNKDYLESELKKIFENFPNSTETFANKVADVYVNYGSGALDGSNDEPAGFSSKKYILKNVLTDNFRNSKTKKLTLGTYLGMAVTNMWTGQKFQTTKFPPGWVSESVSIVTFPGVPATVSSILDPLLLNTNTDFDYTASVWANALHSHAITVVVTINGFIPGPNGPIPAPPLIKPIK